MTPPSRSETVLRRAGVVRIYEVHDRLVVLGRDGRGQELVGDSAVLARAVSSFFEEAHTVTELLEHLEIASGAPIGDPRVVHELVNLLTTAGVLEVVDPDDVSGGLPLRRHGPTRIVLGVTGAVATMHTPALVQALQRRGFTVRVVATENAMRFVTADALRALTHSPVVTSIWPETGEVGVPHIDLARWADAVVVCPASATTISRLATADHSCVLAATVLASHAPVLVVPSMNPTMYGAPGVQRNLEQLVADGMHVAHPATGLEMADPPRARRPLLGAAPPAAVIVQLVEAMLHGERARTRSPRSASDWDAFYRQHDERELPWQASDLDQDIAEALARAASSPASVLDIGTGLGTVAIACAERGHRVVATDLSAVALEQARARAPTAPVVWVQDDITATHLHTSFDVVIDRGCFHLLTPAERVGYAAAVVKLTAPSGTLLVKSLAGPEAEARGAWACSGTELQALLGPAFELLEERDSALPGPGQAPSAHLFVLRRTSFDAA